MLLGTYSNVFETPLTAFTTLFPLRYHSLITAPAYMVTYACLQPACVRVPLLALSPRMSTRIEDVCAERAFAYAQWVCNRASIVWPQCGADGIADPGGSG